MTDSNFLSRAALLAIWAGFAMSAAARDANATTTTITAATGTITQLNYNGNGEIAGFLIGTNILLSFPSSVCGGIGSLGVAGNSVTYSGTAFTATSGFESVQLSSFTNYTTTATYTAPTGKPTTYGPTTGTVTQLNYGEGGAIDGFNFTPSSSTSHIFVAIGSRPSSTLISLLTVDATVTVTGTTSPQRSACSSSGTLESVAASTLVIGSQTIAVGGGPNGPFGHR